MAFQPRSYQKTGPLAIWEGTHKRYCGVMHRRAGKDRTWWNLMVQMAQRDVGLYYYWLPTFAWAKRVIWLGLGTGGYRFLHDIPKPFLRRQRPFNEAELRINYENGSIIQLVGSDNISDSLVGTNPIGNVFSEYAIGNPAGWHYIMPILDENNGWAAFIFTPRGRNWGYDLYNVAKDDDEWLRELKTVDDTWRDAPGEDGSRVVTEENIDRSRRHGMPEEVVQQEYYCSFAPYVAGSYFGRAIEALRDKGKIARVPYDRNLLVHTAWDLGINNATSVWFFQVYGAELRFLEHEEWKGEGLPGIIAEIRAKDYTYGNHLAPHDVQVRDFSTGVSRLETARNLGVSFTPVPRLAKVDQRNAVYAMLDRCCFDSELCEPGLTFLGQYHAKYNEEGDYYSSKPDHDETSNAADAFQTLAVGLSQVENATPEYAYAVTDFDPYDHQSPRQMSVVDWEMDTYVRTGRRPR